MKLFDHPLIILSILLIVPLIIAGIIIWTLIKAVKIPTETYESANLNKLLAIALIAFFNMIGVIMFFAYFKPRLAEAEEQAGPLSAR